MYYGLKTITKVLFDTRVAPRRAVIGIILVWQQYRPNRHVYVCVNAPRVLRGFRVAPMVSPCIVNENSGYNHHIYMARS